MAKRIVDLRREHEAAEARKAEGGEAEAPKTKGRKAAAKKAPAARKKRVKEKATVRKRLVWGIFSGSMKEEARFAYDQREAAEERIEQLRAKSKKMYFIQPIKEVIAESAPPPKAAAAAPAEADEE